MTKRWFTMLAAGLFLSLALGLCIIPAEAYYDPVRIWQLQAQRNEERLAQAETSVFALEILQYNERGQLRLKEIKTAVKLNHDGTFLTLLTNLESALNLMGQPRGNTVLRLSRPEMTESVPCRVLIMDAEADLCLLKVDEENLTAIEDFAALPLVEKRPPVLGRRLIHFNAADPFSETRALASGDIIATKPPIITESGIEMDIFESNAYVSRGAVSGPAFTEDGYFLGISMFKQERNATDRNAYFLTADSLERFLLRFHQRVDDPELMLRDKLWENEYLPRPIELPAPDPVEDPNRFVPRTGHEATPAKSLSASGELTPETMYDLPLPSPVYLGLKYYADDYYATLKSRFGFGSGVMIYSVDRSGPAYTAMLSPKDLIIRANDRLIYDFGDLQRVLAKLSAGDLLTLEVVKEDGSEQTYKVYVKKGLLAD